MRLDRLRFRPSALVLYRCGHTEVWTSMGFDRGRKGDRGGRGRDKRDDFFGGETFTEQGGGFQERGGYGGGGGGGGGYPGRRGGGGVWGGARGRGGGRG